MAPVSPVLRSSAVGDRSWAETRDRDDPLGHHRERFHLPEGLLYLDGNSLGPVIDGVAERLHAVVDDEWGQGLIRSWNSAGWIDLAGRAAAKVAPLIGAAADRVMVADSTSINLFKLLVAALDARPGRTVILSETRQFPTDLYMAQGLERLCPGVELRVVERHDLDAALDDSVAVLYLTHVDFRSGAMHDMAAWTRKAHDQGALVLWDLSHSAGAVPLELDAWDVDFAVGCGYKYLNGGPGAPAFLYVHERFHDTAFTPLAGWLGHANPFEFSLDYRPAPGVMRFTCGTPPILSLAAFDAALDAFDGVAMDAMRRKSMELGDYFLGLVDARCAGLGLEVESPRDATVRGSQVALRHPQGYAIIQALIDRGVIGDFREPDILRFGLTPLYLRFVDIWDAVEHLRTVLADELWNDPKYSTRNKVT